MAASLSGLRRHVLKANVEIARRGLARFTFGNASGIDRAQGLVVIKPSGVPYEKLRAADLCVVTLDGKQLAGKLRPSSDLPTHLELYRAFKQVGGIVHTHSHFATVWAQSGLELPCLGTTHADYFRGAVPVTEMLDAAQVTSNYERNTGRAIVERFAGLDPLEHPAVLVRGHASFCWGGSVGAAVEIAEVLEEVAAMALRTVTLNPAVLPISQALHEKHFTRKHGKSAYYGQAEAASRRGRK